MDTTPPSGGGGGGSNPPRGTEATTSSFLFWRYNTNMKIKLKENLPLLLGVGIPLVIVLLLVVFTTVLPALLVKPAYDFVYADSYRYYPRPVVAVDADGRVTTTEGDEKVEVQFYRHSVASGANTPLTKEEVDGLTLNPSDVSPDGYKFVSGNGDGDIFIFPLFYEGGGTAHAIERNGWIRKGVALRGEAYQVEFVGWIIE